MEKKSGACRTGITKRWPGVTGCLSWMANTDPFLSMAFEITSGWQQTHVETVAGCGHGLKSVSS
jgi:hypothetical protein